MKSLSTLSASLTATAAKATALGGVLAGALAVGGLGAAVSAASDFEDAMVEVQKVTDAETTEELSGRMRDLAKDIPVAADELANLAADAARFGIRGSENIEQFTTTVAKMSTATDLSTQEAGEAFAKLATLTDTPISEIENFGSAINELGNNFATSSSEIVDSMLRSSAALSQFGLNQTQIIGFSAAINEASESSQLAGRRLRRVAQELMNPKNVEDLADALGMTSEEFTTMREESPNELLIEMAEAFAEGGETADDLRKTLGTASRQAIAALAQNLDGLREAVDTSNRAYEEGTTLQEEFDAATDTFSSRVTVLKNNIRDMAITVGNRLLPVLNPLLERFNDMLASGEGIGSWGDQIANALDSVISRLSTLMNESDSLTEFIKLVINDAVSWVKSTGIDLLGSLVSTIRDSLITLLGGDAEEEGLFSAFRGWLGRMLDRVDEWMQSGGKEKITNVITSLFSAITGVLQGQQKEFEGQILDPLLSILSGLFDSISAALRSPEASQLGQAIGRTAIDMMRLFADKLVEYAGSEAFREDLKGLAGALANSVVAILVGAFKESGIIEHLQIGELSDTERSLVRKFLGGEDKPTPTSQTNGFGSKSVLAPALSSDRRNPGFNQQIEVTVMGDTGVIEEVSATTVRDEFKARELRNERVATRRSGL